MTRKEKTATSDRASKVATSCILYILKKRLEAAKTELSDARDAFGYTGAGGYVAHAEGRIEELESIIKSLKG